MNNITPKFVSFKESFVTGDPITRLESNDGKYNLVHNHVDGSWDYEAIQSCMNAIKQIAEEHNNNQELKNSLSIAADSHHRIIRVIDQQSGLLRKARSALPSSSTASTNRNRPEREIKIEPKTLIQEPQPQLPPLVSPPVSQNESKNSILQQPLSPGLEEEPQPIIAWRLHQSIEDIQIPIQKTSMSLIEIRKHLNSTLERMYPRSSQRDLIQLMEITSTVIILRITTPFFTVENDPSRTTIVDYSVSNAIKSELLRIFSPQHSQPIPQYSYSSTPAAPYNAPQAPSYSSYQTPSSQYSYPAAPSYQAPSSQQPYPPASRFPWPSSQQTYPVAPSYQEPSSQQPYPPASRFPWPSSQQTYPVAPSYQEPSSQQPYPPASRFPWPSSQQTYPAAPSYQAPSSQQPYPPASRFLSPSSQQTYPAAPSYQEPSSQQPYPPASRFPWPSSQQSYSEAPSYQAPSSQYPDPQAPSYQEPSSQQPYTPASRFPWPSSQQTYPAAPSYQAPSSQNPYPSASEQYETSITPSHRTTERQQFFDISSDELPRLKQEHTEVDERDNQVRGEKRTAPTTTGNTTSEPSKKKVKTEASDEKAEAKKSELATFIKKEESEEED